MTKRFCVLAVIAALGSSIAAMAGTGGSAPEQLGAHWAHVSDARQIQLLIDGLQSSAPGSIAERIMRRTAGVTAEVVTVARPTLSGMPALSLEKNAAQIQFTSGDQVTLARGASSWYLSGGSLPKLPENTYSRVVASANASYSVGTTFITTPISGEYGINRLSRGVTGSKIGRSLFSTPRGAASYYSVHYMRTAPFATATYIQFVLDPSWGRIVYGNLNRWIKAYDDVVGPTSIAVDPDGRVFVSETGRRRIAVLQVNGEGDDAQLHFRFSIDGIESPVALAHSDNGTPLDASDDILYVADGSGGAILKYSLSANGATLMARFTGFDSPTALAVGRWNGAANGFLYVIDAVAKRVRVMEDLGGTLSSVGEYRGTYDQYFSSVSTDHFGNVYIVDNTNARLFKLTAALEPLDEEGGAGDYEALATVDIPFGKITIDGEGTVWAGFDQLFAVERWSDESGAQRRTLGLRLKDIAFTTDDDVSHVAAQFVMTDFGTVGARIYDADGKLVRTLASSPMVSGRKQLIWDRRNEAGQLVPGGAYRYELSASSTYRDEAVTATVDWNLPLYYEEVGGFDAPHLVQGSAASWGAVHASEDPNTVRFRFSGLNPSGKYSVEVEYQAGDGTSRLQELTTGNGTHLAGPTQVGASVVSTGYVEVPQTSYAGGELVLNVNRLGNGTAVVSRLLLKETGTQFSATPEDQAIPVRYALDQNYPNPFNPATIIRYALPAGGPVRLRIYDITGREVATLVDETKPAGTYEVRFDTNAARPGGLASGVYFYKIEAGSFVQTRKMLVLR